MPNMIPSECWKIVSIEMIGELLDSQGFNAILVVVDQLSKQIHVVPTITSLDSANIACLFLDNVWRHYGLPEQVLSDWGLASVSRFAKELAGLLGVKLTPLTAYHPQTDGQTEWVNQEIETYLGIFINHCQDDWS